MQDLDQIIADALGDHDELGITDVTITRRTAGTRDPANLAAGTQPTSVTYTGRGFIERTGRFRDGTLVKEGSALISVFGGTISDGAGVEEGDVIAIGGRSYKVSKAKGDSVGAVFECEAK